MAASFIEQARKCQIVAATIKVLAREGFARASLSRIAREAGISKSIISYHFAGKEALFEAVFAHVADSAGAYMTPFLLEAGDPAGQLMAYITHQIAYMAGHRDELIAIGTLALNLGGPEGGPDYIARAGAEERAILVSLMEAGQRAGQFRSFDSQVMAAVMSKAIESALAEWAWRPETDLAAYARELVDLFSRAMRKGQGDG